MNPLQRQSKGQVLVLVALLMLVLIGVAALAIDLGRAYGVKAKLNAAVDAASYEAANALAQGSGESGMVEEAKKVAASYFSANYPGTFLGATPNTPTVTAVRNASGKWNVNVEATAQMPTIFAGLFVELLDGTKTGAFNSFNIRATSEAVRATLDMVLVLDTTNSLALPAFNVFPDVQAGAQRFVEHFSELDDRVGLVAFSTGAYPIVDICGKFPNQPSDGGIQNPGAETLGCRRGFKQAKVQEAIGTLNAGGMTASEEGMKKALNQLNALASNVRSGTRVIVFFSDGAPNTFNGRFQLAAGGTKEGNLYSGPRGELLDKIYDSSKYYDFGPDSGRFPLDPVSSVPDSDAQGAVSTKSHNKKRELTGSSDINSLRCDANIAARNMTENVANEARRQGITVFTLGYGKQLDEPEMLDPSCSTHYELGSTIMKRLANTRDSDSYDSKQPTGIFCRAPSVAELGPCFNQIASAILRISK